MCLDLGGSEQSAKNKRERGTRLALAWEQALHLGNIVKSRRERRRESKGRAASLLARAARFSRPNRRACLQVRLARAYPHLVGYFLNQSLNLAHIYQLQGRP